MIALSTIGSDLSVSVSFVIAREMLEGATEAQMTDDELIAIVLGLSIVFTAIESSVQTRLSERASVFLKHAERDAKAQAEALGLGGDKELAFVGNAVRDTKQLVSMRHSALDFAHLLLSIARQIAFSITIQLLAASARAREPSRAVRILTLLGLVVFFLFVQSNGSKTRLL